MFTSSNFTKTEQISLSQEIALVGIEHTPLTSLLMSKGKIEKALSTVYTWKEKQLDQEDDLSAVEGSDDIKFYSSSKRELSNILEIFVKGASVSGSAIAMKSTQLSDELKYRLLELKLNMEKKFLTGLKLDGSQAPYKRQLSGLIEMADDDNAIEVTGTVTEQTVKDVAKKLWDQNLVGGNVYAFVNSDIKEQIDEIYKDRYGYTDVTTEFGLIVSAIRTNYGKVNFVLSPQTPADKMIVFNDNYVDLAYLREPHFEALSKTGDNVKGMVVAEATVKVGSPKGVAVVTVTE